MTKTPFFIRKARLDLIRSQNVDHLAVMRFRLLGKKILFLAEDIWNWLSAPRVIALLMLLGGMLGFFMDYAFQQEYSVAWSLSLENNVFIAMGPEFVSIAIGVLIIDWANARFQREQKVEGLIRQLKSEFISTSLDALAELRVTGWLYDGTLERENLTQANLPDADLVAHHFIEPEVGSIVRQDLPPQLKGAELRFTILKGAILEGADLSKTNLVAADLRDANLRCADLQAANLRAVGFIRTDLRGSNLGGANLTDANLKDAIIRENFPICDRKTVLPDGTYWSSNHDLYRFVDPNREDFWEAPVDKFIKIEDQFEDKKAVPG